MMGKTRVCGKRCHIAKCAKCRCWCGGLFHGDGGRESREAFAQEFSVHVPTTEAGFGKVIDQQLPLFNESGADRWRAAITAARAARIPNNLTPVVTR